MKTLIVGGGIGGLSAAISLARLGHDITLVEKAPSFEPVGAGIIMAPNAANVLADLGVDLSQYGHALPSLDLVRADGSLLQRMETQRLSERYGPLWSLSRPVLHSALLAAVPDEVRLIHGRSVSTVRNTGDGVAVRFDEGADTHLFDVVVGADGLRSTVRELVLGPQPVRYSGDTCWRGVTRNPGYTRAVEAWGPGTRIGLIPLRDQQLYYYLVKMAPARAAGLDWPDGFRQTFRHYQGDLAKLFDVLTEAPPLHHDLEELDSPVWGDGDRVFLLGDAAHAMTPNQGQGAAMAIEDAYGLMQALTPGVAGAAARYRALRHRRVRSVQLSSRNFGRLSHWTSPAARWTRDLLMRSLPQSVSHRQYHKLVQPALEMIGATPS